MNPAATAPAWLTVSAIVVCYNEEENIGACLESLRWCDEIVVVDSFSTDGTVEICRRYTDRVIQKPWSGYRDQKAFAHSQATNWVLLVDADERVTPELREEIGQALIRDKNEYSEAMRCPGWFSISTGGGAAVGGIRTTMFACFAASARPGGTYSHEKIIVDGRVRRLRQPLHHFTYRNIEDHVERINRFTSISSRGEPG